MDFLTSLPVYYIIGLYFYHLLSILHVTLLVPPQDLIRLKLDLQEALMVKEEQEDLLRRRERELTALKGALKEEVSTHDLEVDKLREKYDKEIRKLQASLVEVKQVTYYRLSLLSLLKYR